MSGAEEGLDFQTRVLVALARIDEKLGVGMTRMDNSEADIKELQGDVTKLKLAQASPLRAYAVPLSLAGTVVSTAVAILAVFIH